MYPGKGTVVLIRPEQTFYERIKLREAQFAPRDDINTALHAGVGERHGGRNVETKYSAPDGVMVDISQAGWVGTDTP